MPNEGTDAQEVESKETETAKTEAEVKGKTETEKEVTVGDALDNKEPKKEPKMVPEAVLIEAKRQTKAAQKALKDLQANIESGASSEEVNIDLDTIAAEYPDVDPNFLKKFAKAVSAQAKAEAKAETEEEIKPIKEKERAAEVDKIFTEHYDKTLDAMPEYKDIANKEVVKTLSLDPKNANKTFAQILELAYGHLVKGKRTLEKEVKPRGGKEDDTEIDMKKANADPAYFKEIMADPELKKQYNAGLAKRLQL